MNRGFSARPRARGAAARDPQDLAARALAHIASDPDSLADFLAVTGVTPDTLRAAASGAGFTRGVLSYMLADDTLLIRFARSEGSDTTALARAMQAAIGPLDGEG